MRLDAYPVIGPLSAQAPEDRWDQTPTDFFRFEAPCGVHGLAHVQNRDLHLLAVAAVTPGVGQFRRFIGECKNYYEFIRLWAVMDDELRHTLIRYAFKKGYDADKFGDFQEVWDWTSRTA